MKIPILDVACGARMFYFGQHDPGVANHQQDP